MARNGSRVLGKKYTPPYIFDRKMREDEGELPEAVVTLRWPFLTPPCPSGESTQEWEDVFAGSEVYVVGTNHAMKSSEEDVKTVINRVRPDVVMVELCAKREGSLWDDDSKTGGEFRMAYRLAQEIPCQFVLGDRHWDVTEGRLLRGVSLWEMTSSFVLGIGRGLRRVGDGLSSEEHHNKLKKKNFLDQYVKEYAGVSPSRMEIILAERDKYLTNTLHELIANHTLRKREEWKRMVGGVKWQPLKIVGVVGLAHRPGIVANWGKQMDISELSRIPERPMVHNGESWKPPGLFPSIRVALRRIRPR